MMEDQAFQLQQKEAAPDPEQESLDFQLELTKLEIETINDIIARMDGITQTVKNWAIVVWAGSITLLLGQQDLRKYIGITALLPILFWITEARWRVILRRSTFRSIKIHDFLNDGRLQESFKQKKLVGLAVLDPVGRQYANTDEYKKFTSFWCILRFFEVWCIYAGLIIISVGLGIFFLLCP